MEGVVVRRRDKKRDRMEGGGSWIRGVKERERKKG